jgi:hypothetical protein
VNAGEKRQELLANGQKGREATTWSEKEEKNGLTLDYARFIRNLSHSSNRVDRGDPESNGWNPRCTAHRDSGGDTIPGIAEKIEREEWGSCRSG